MIGYFTKSGDTEVSSVFGPYRQTFKRIMKKRLADRKYGTGLDLILIQYHLEGKYLELPTKMYKVKSYSKKERALSVVVGVPQGFKELSDIAKRQFIVDTTLESIGLVQEKMLRLGFTEIDFELLIHDINECAKEFLSLKTIV